MEKVNELENLVQAFKDDYEKFKEKGNKQLEQELEKYYKRLET